MMDGELAVIGSARQGLTCTTNCPPPGIAHRVDRAEDVDACLRLLCITGGRSPSFPDSWFFRGSAHCLSMSWAEKSYDAS